MPVTPNPLLDLTPGIGSVQNTVEYRVLTPALEDTGQRLHPFSAGGITANVSAAIQRTMSSFVLGETDWRSLNLFQARVQPVWVLEDGTQWPLGVFMFTDSSGHKGTYASTLEAAMMDQGYILGLKSREPFGVVPGGSIRQAIIALFGQVGMINFVLPETDVAIADPNAWPSGTTRRTMLDYLCQAAGWMPVHFDNYGIPVVRPPPDLASQSPDHRYRGNRVQFASPVEEANNLTAPNTIVVTGTGPSQGDISAVAYVDPSLPYSVPNRGGLEVVQTIEMQGLVSTEQAYGIAVTLASQAPGYLTQKFTGPADPRHDLFQTVEYMDGVVYRETSFDLSLAPGGFMNHTLTLGGWNGASWDAAGKLRAPNGRFA